MTDKKDKTFEFELGEVAILKDTGERVVIQSRQNFPHPFDVINQYGIRPEATEGPSTDFA